MHGTCANMQTFIDDFEASTCTPVIQTASPPVSGLLWQPIWCCGIVQHRHDRRDGHDTFASTQGVAPCSLAARNPSSFAEGGTATASAVRAMLKAHNPLPHQRVEMYSVYGCLLYMPLQLPKSASLRQSSRMRMFSGFMSLYQQQRQAPCKGCVAIREGTTAPCSPNLVCRRGGHHTLPQHSLLLLPCGQRAGCAAYWCHQPIHVGFQGMPFCRIDSYHGSTAPGCAGGSNRQAEYGL